MKPRTNTPDVRTVADDGTVSTRIRLKRACNGCGVVVGDLLDRDIAADGRLVDVRSECGHCLPLVDAEAAGGCTWHLTERALSGDSFTEIRRLTTPYRAPDDSGRMVFRGISLGAGPDCVVARFGDWIIRHPDDRWAVHQAPGVAS